MADFARFLPLSNRPRHDERAVTSDRRAEVAALVDEAARLIASAGAEPLLTERFVADARLTGAALGEDLAVVSGRIRIGPRRGIRDLARTLNALLLLARSQGATPEVDPLTSGAVALYAATSGPFERRAVLNGHTVRASDSEWAFGSGPVLEGTALSIAAFALGVSDEPPAPLSSPR